MMLVGNASSQTQTAPPTKTPPATQSQSAPAKKATTTPAAKSTVVAPFKTPKEKFSYALGMYTGGNLGANLQRQSVEVDANLVAQGLKDALAGGKMRLTPEEMQAVLTAMQTEVRQKFQERMKLAGEANKKEGPLFLAANKTKPGVVTLPSGLQYKILQAGTGPKPTATDTVTCNYRGTFINGTEFDSSYKYGKPATFPLNGVIKGWNEALQLMPVGSKWQLFIPSELAYGEQGNPGGGIAPNATLIFELELLSIQPKDQQKK